MWLCHVEQTVLVEIREFNKLDVLIYLLFNGISTFLGYFMPNPSFQKDSSGTI